MQFFVYGELYVSMQSKQHCFLYRKLFVCYFRVVTFFEQMIQTLIIIIPVRWDGPLKNDLHSDKLIEQKEKCLTIYRKR